MHYKSFNMSFKLRSSVKVCFAPYEDFLLCQKDHCEETSLYVT